MPPTLDGSTRSWRLEIPFDGVPRGQRGNALASALRRKIRDGTLPAGTRLPASRVLADDLGVSRGLVVRTYEQLTAEGFLDARQGRWTEVADVVRSDAGELRSLEHRSTNPGLPSGEHFPRRAWARSALRAVDQLSDVEWSYGDPAGLPALRRALSSYLGRVRGTAAPAGSIVIVNGFAQGSRLLVEALRSQGVRRIGIEGPGSIGLRDQLQRAGAECVPIAVDEHGIRVDDLEGSGVAAVVVTPAHQFPTGVVMNPQRRHELLAWARRTGGLVIEDDYDAEFRYDRAPVGALHGLGPDVVVYGGSVSKTLAPGLRLGWLVVPEPLLEAVRDAKYDADLATSVWLQATLAEFLERGEMDRHVRRTALRYRQRRDRLVAELAAHLPSWSVSGTAAGLHLVVRPGDALAIDEHLAEEAREAGLDARPLTEYAMGTQPGPNGLVIGYGHQTPDSLAAAVASLARAISGSP